MEKVWVLAKEVEVDIVVWMLLLASVVVVEIEVEGKEVLELCVMWAEGPEVEGVRFFEL